MKRFLIYARGPAAANRCRAAMDWRQHRHPFHTLARSAARIALLAAAALALQGCALNGDFGRPKHSTVLLAQAFHDVTDHFADGGEPSFYNLTDDEVEMRELAYRLRMKVHAPLPAAFIPYNESGYANHLTATARINGPSRLATIDDEVNGDHEALTRFGQAARLVLMADRRRLMSLAKGSPHYSQNDVDNAFNRVEQNYAFMDGTFRDLDNRIAAYRHAVDRSKLETPAVTTIAVENAVNHLHERSLALRYELSEFHQTSVQHFGPMEPLPPIEEGLPPPPPPFHHETMKPAAPPPPPPDYYGPAANAKPVPLTGPWKAKTASIGR